MSQGRSSRRPKPSSRRKHRERSSSVDSLYDSGSERQRRKNYKRSAYSPVPKDQQSSSHRRRRRSSPYHRHHREHRAETRIRLPAAKKLDDSVLDDSIVLSSESDDNQCDVNVVVPSISDAPKTVASDPQGPEPASFTVSILLI